MQIHPAVSSVLNTSVSEFNEFEPRLISAKNWFQLNIILSGTNHISAAALFKLQLKFFKFGLRLIKIDRKCFIVFKNVKMFKKNYHGEFDYNV